MKIEKNKPPKRNKNKLNKQNHKKTVQKTKSNKSTNIAISLIIAGISILLSILAFGIYAKQQQAQSINTYIEKNIKNKTQFKQDLEKAKAYNKNIANLFNQSIDQESLTKLEDYNKIFDGNNGIFGILTINKIDLKLPIYHGTSDEALMKGVGHVPETSFPIDTDASKSILTGHNGVPGADMLFTRLDEMEKKDKFEIQISDYSYHYTVKKIKPYLTPDEAEKYAQAPNKLGSKPEVVLITCTPYGINTHRFLVIGEFTYKEKAKNQKVKPSTSIGFETKVILAMIIASTIILIIIYILHRKTKKAQK